MSLKKFRKIMKPVTLVVAIAMIGSGAWLTLKNFLDHPSGTAQYACEVNGEKISKAKLAREENSLSEQLSKVGQGQASKEMISLLAFQKSIDDTLTLQLADEMKIKVSSSEVNDEYKKVEESIGNKDQFKKMLSVQGYSKKSFKGMLGENLLIQKTLDRFHEESGKDGKDGNSLYQEALAKKREEMKLENVSPEFAKLQVSVIEEIDGFKITNVDMAERATQMMLMTGAPEKQVTDFLKGQYRKEIAFAKKAQKEGVEIPSNLPLNVQLVEYGKVLFDKYKKEVKVDDAELKKFFETNQEKYSLHANLDASIAVLKINVREADLAKIEKEAKDTLAGLTPENFAKTGQELQSKHPENIIYEELGWFEKGAMVKEFEEAAFSAKHPEIYPQVITTKFGKHLLDIQEIKDDRVKAAHILFREVPTQESVELSLKEAEEIRERLAKKEITFESLKTFNKNILFVHDFQGIDKSGVIPGFIQDPEFVKFMYEAPLNQVEIFAKDHVIKNGWIYLFEKTKEVKDKKVSLDEVKDKAIDDYKSWKAQQKIQKLF